jgi:hypothetical protein
MLMVVALLFTATVTPVEVAFLGDEPTNAPLWVINRVVDLAFTIDIVLTFNVAFQETPTNGGYWVFNKYVIMLHYLKGWFLIDLLSIIPFWIVTMEQDDPFGTYAAAHAAQLAQYSAPPSLPSGEPQTPTSWARTSVLFRIVKLLRMLKLARVLKASRVIQRALLDFVMNQWEWTYAVLKMMKLLLVLVAYAHLQACLWGLVSSYMRAENYPNWISTFVDDYGEIHEGAVPSGLEVYGAALYWSVMTLTSIGYGEMTPINTAERFLCSVYMLGSGVLWTYVIGCVAAIATTLDPNSIIYQNTMDSLNYFMREARPRPRPPRLRAPRPPHSA